jgi:hypothetical protein
MKKTLFLPLLILASTFMSCNQCEKTEASEIEFGLIVSGYVTVYSKQGGQIVTSEWEGLGITVLMNKVYCSGRSNGPFEYNYTTDNTGQLLRSGAGYFSFRMDNTNDYMDIDFFCGGREIGESAIGYDILKAYAGQTAHPYYEIKIIWDYELNDIHDSTVKLIY